MARPDEQDRLPIARPTLGAEEEQAVLDVLRSGWVSQGPRVMEFENRLSEYLGCQFVRAVNSGTSAILLALKAIGVGPGHSVVVPAFTCAATALPALALGAKIAFADIQISSFNISWPDVEKALRPDTKAVILVHLFGRMADAAQFASRCCERHVHLVEDACCALGAQQNAKRAGSFGTAGCFSFHPRKIITTGEGGAVCTNDDRVAERVGQDRSYGAVSSAWARFQQENGSPRGFERVAYNFKLTDLQATVGIAQMDKLPVFLEQRRRLAERYSELLSGMPGIQLPAPISDPETDVCQSVVCLWTPRPMETLMSDSDALKRAIASLDVLRSAMSSDGIAVSDAAQFLPELPVFRSVRSCEENLAEQYPAASIAAKLAFALPVFPEMTPKQVERVVDAVANASRAAMGD